jgi:hypothetical protein
VVLDALAIGTGSLLETLPFRSCSVGGVITGKIVERDSGRRRVRKSVDACRYILEMCEEPWREEEELVEEESNCEEDKVVVTELLDGMMSRHLLL